MKSSNVGRADRIGTAIAAIVCAVLALSLGDALIKLMSSDLSFWQLYVLRSLIALPLLLAIIRIGFSGLDLRPRSVPWVIVRSLLMGFNWILFYAALPYVPLSIAAAAYYTSPLFITLFAGLFVGEPVRRTDWCAVMLGFTGVLIMLKPDSDGVNLFALLPIGAAILYALTSVVTRTKCAEEEALVLSFSLNLTFFLIGLVMTLILLFAGPPDALVSSYPFLLGPWTALRGFEWLMLGALAIIIVIGSIGAAFAYQSGPLPVIATFDYSYLAFATLWGVLFFGETPDLVSVGGMAMIVAAGLFVIRR